MDRTELLMQSIGENIDRLVTLDPTGTGIIRILYQAARNRSGEPLCLRAARRLQEAIGPGGRVFLTTGFVFEPHGKGELDGLTGTALLIRALLQMDATLTPVVFCETAIAPAMSAVLHAAGVNVYSTPEEADPLPVAAAVVGIPSDEGQSRAIWEPLLSTCPPRAMIAVEKPGQNAAGVYHQGTGIDVSRHCARVDSLFEACAAAGIPTFAVGDLGNEIGMAAIASTIRRYIPLGETCACGCGGGICVRTEAEHLVVAATSDWGCYGWIAALSALTGDLDLLPTADLERRVCLRANDAGLIDGSGWAIPSIDGVCLEDNVLLLALLRRAVEYPIRTLKQKGARFDAVIEKGFFGTGGKGDCHEE